MVGKTLEQRWVTSPQRVLEQHSCFARDWLILQLRRYFPNIITVNVFSMEQPTTGQMVTELHVHTEPPAPYALVCRGNLKNASLHEIAALIRASQAEQIKRSQA